MGGGAQAGIAVRPGRYPWRGTQQNGTSNVKPLVDFSRRRVLAIAAAGVAASHLSGCSSGGTPDRGLVLLSLDQAMAELDRLARAAALQSDTAWTWAQTLDHCAQSVEYSMTGFPQARSALFQNTVGSAAFKVFAWRGRMTHDLGEPIPGAPALDANTRQAEARLREAVSAFAHWTGPLRPHFAYGALGRAEYAQAHAMHLANHFSAFDLKA